MNARAYVRLSATVFAIVALGHAVRAAMNLPVQAAGVAIPVWLSWPGAAGAGILAAWGFFAARRI